LPQVGGLDRCAFKGGRSVALIIARLGDVHADTMPVVVKMAT
jgi:hypothetical protein